MSSKVYLYRGVVAKKHRICDVIAVKSRARWYFAYVDGEPTGDHFRTLRGFNDAVNAGWFKQYGVDEPIPVID